MLSLSKKSIKVFSWKCYYCAETVYIKDVPYLNKEVVCSKCIKTGMLNSPYEQCINCENLYNVKDMDVSEERFGVYIYCCYTCCPPIPLRKENIRNTYKT